MMEWQPIEKAPKDGTVLLLIRRGFQPVVGEWSEDVGWWFAESDSPPDDWDAQSYKPTHWMPLPEPPK